MYICICIYIYIYIYIRIYLYKKICLELRDCERTEKFVLPQDCPGAPVLPGASALPGAPGRRSRANCTARGPQNAVSGPI